VCVLGGWALALGGPLEEGNDVWASARPRALGWRLARLRRRGCEGARARGVGGRGCWARTWWALRAVA
jgi:hypothetical protein